MKVVHANDARVSERLHNADLAEEIADGLRIDADLFWQHFDGNVSVQAGMARLVDDPHAAAPDLFIHFEATRQSEARKATHRDTGVEFDRRTGAAVALDGRSRIEVGLRELRTAFGAELGLVSVWRTTLRAVGHDVLLTQERVAVAGYLLQM